jgi:multidrug efflux pump subunit AcrA (membrane-fusion protein)
MFDSTDITPPGIVKVDSNPLSTWQSQDLPVVQSQEFLPPISRWTTWGGILMLSTISVAVCLAAITKYRITVASQAMIRPVGELRLVQANSEGQIVEIFSKENQLVKQGEVIATLENSKVITKKKQLEIQIDQIKLRLEQFDAQINTIDQQIKAEIERSKRLAASNNARLNLSKRNYQDKQVTTAAAVREAEANLSVVQSERQKAQVQLKSLQADYQSAEASLKAAVSKQERYQKISQQGAISLDQFAEVKLAAQQQQQKVIAQKGVVEAQQKTIEQLAQSIQMAQAKLQGLKANLNPTNAEVSIASENLAQEQASGASTLAVVNRERESLVQKKIELNQQLEQDKRELQQIGTNLQQTMITATTSGIVTKLNLRNPGQVVKAGEEIAQIFPSDNSLTIETTVSPAEINNLKTGQQVKMQISACPYPDYGTLEGEVGQISADTIKASQPNENALSAKVSQSIPSYKVTIRPHALFLARGNKKCVIQSGMEGKAEIIAGEETFLQFLLRKSKLTLNQPHNL